MARIGTIILLMISVLIAACDHPPSYLSFLKHSMPDLPDTQLQSLEFKCVHEADVISKRDPEADQLYQHAKWLKKNNLLKEDPLVYPKIERLIRIASAHGHDKASLELSQMIGKGTAMSDDIVGETLDLAEDLIKRGIPGGYYDMAQFLESGYGVKEDKDLALKYYRKAADMGNPDAQYHVGDILTGVDDQTVKDIGRKMWRCAAEQGHSEAGLELGINLAGYERYPEALQAYQLGAKAGDSTAASFLSKGFNGPKPDNRLHYLGQQKDEERYERYDAIRHLLSAYSYLNPKVPEIDDIVPLPPAKLPAWDGTFKWLKEHEANVPPPLPTEERIKEMAKAKNLDPETGRPDQGKRAEAGPATDPAPVKAAATPRLPLGTSLASGTNCPQSGLWQCSASTSVGGDRRFFTVGETLPTVLVPVDRSWLQRLKGDPDKRQTETVWALVAYPKNASTPAGKDA